MVVLSDKEMTRSQRNQFATNYSLLLDRMENNFIAKVYKALRTQVNSFLFDAHYGIDFAKNRMNTNAFNMQIGPVIMRLYITAGLISARKTRVTLREQKALTMGRSDILTDEIRRYFQQHLFDKVVLPISETTKDIILKAIIKGQEQGWSVPRILEEIGRTDVSRMRARRIVRTETVRASNFGSLLSAYNEPFEMTKEWIAVNDKRTRHSHHNIDGQKRDLIKEFSNGLMFPGDPNGSAAETVNCRCALAYSAKRDSKGKLIPKKDIPAQGGSISLRTSLVDILAGLAIGNLIENLISEP